MESSANCSTPSDGICEEGVKQVRVPHGRTFGPTRRSTKGQWTPEEDNILCMAVQRFKGKNWKKIAECFKDRSDVQCLHRWQKVLNPELVKGPWSKEEDLVIVELVDKFGPKKWSTIAQHLPGRIGKQCRERWHNHLNPSINKEAWTQEEELALIQAHQLYGNKWAELTKFLPGRTDNSIKNHWNSSVKKKLDSYMKSGLLAQSEGLPLVRNQSQPAASSSLRIQNSGDESAQKGTEADEISEECSQESAIASRIQPGNEMAIAAPQTGHEPSATEVSGSSGMEPNFSSAACAEPYYPSLDEPIFVENHDIGFVNKFLQQNYTNDAEVSISGDYRLNLQDITNFSSVPEGHEMMGAYPHCVAFADESHETHNVPLLSYGELTASVRNNVMDSDKSEHMLITDDECCRVLFSEAMKDEGFSSANLDLEGYAIPLVCESDIEASEQVGEPGNLEVRLPTSSDGPAGPSCTHSFISRLVSTDGDQITFDADSGRFFGAQGQEYTCADDGFIYTSDTANSPCEDTDMTVQEQRDNDPSKLVPVNVFCSGFDTQLSLVDARRNEHREDRESGGLCYEPPRFPCSEIPFFSCDLAQPSGEIQQEYSPLGIRQLMMSSMNSCLTPFRMWDSPARVGSPDAVLKSAAKTFTGTPSILKKRHREFLSPLSDKRNRKGPETGENSRPTKDIPRLEVFVDEDKRECKESSPSDRNAKYSDCAEDKENPVSASKEEDVAKKGATESSSMVLIEHNMNILFSPKQLDFRSLGSGVKTPRSQHRKLYCGKHGVIPLSSPSVSGKACDQRGSSPALSQLSSGKTGVDSALETFGLFGGTPFKRSMESPSAWKSPWFINSFVAGPRVDTDITIEDMGYFMSPGERSYDAIGLMKQISEQTAAAYANAQQVLGNKTPPKEDTQEQDGPSNRSHLSQNMLTECRVLDFSECGTPAKGGTENAKPSITTGISSPSSYLLKSCR